MKKFKVLTSFVLIIALMSMLLAGCGSSSIQDSSSKKSSTQVDVNKQANITFLDVMPSPDRTKLYNEIISNFQTTNPNTKVEYTTVPWDDAYKKLVAMGASKTLPDVLTGDIGIMLSLARPGYIEKLTDKWNNWQYKDDLTQAAKVASNLYTYDKDIYIIPDGFLLQGIFVRTDWLKNLGIDPASLQDWTWDDYLDIIQKMTDASKNQYGISFRGGSNGFLRFYEYLGSNLQVSNAFPDGNNKSIFEDPKALDLFKQFYGLYTNGYAPKESINWGFKEMVNSFISGQTGTVNQTPEVTLTAEQNMQPGTWTVLPQPKMKGASKNYMTWGYSGGYMIASNSKEKDAAWSLVNFISSPEENLEYSKGFGCLPIYKSGLSDNFFQSGALKGYADQLLDPNIEYFSQPTELTQWGYFLAEYSKNEVQKYMTGEQTAEQTMANLSQWMKDNYDKDVAKK